MHWEQYKLDIPVLDAQHKQIISCLSDLVQAMREGCSSRDIDEFFTRSELYTIRHFGLEEKYMAESNYPGLEKQRQAHHYFISRLGQLSHEYKESGMSASIVNSLRQELTEWIKNHIAGLDRKFGEYFKHYQKELSGEMPAFPDKTEI